MIQRKLFTCSDIAELFPPGTKPRREEIEAGIKCLFIIAVSGNNSSALLLTTFLLTLGATNERLTARVVIGPRKGPCAGYSRAFWMLPMVRQAHHEDEHKLTMRSTRSMRGNTLQTLGLILSLSKDEEKLALCGCSEKVFNPLHSKRRRRPSPARLDVCVRKSSLWTFLRVNPCPRLTA